MSSLMQQIEKTEARYRKHEEQRNSRRAQVEAVRRGEDAGDWREVDEPARVLNRLIGLGHQDLVGDVMAVMEPSDEQAMGELDLLERILAENNLLGVTFLLKGALVSRAVGRVVIRTGGQIVGFGTGFLASRQAMLTNNHVLGNAGNAAASSIQFNFFEAVPGLPTQALEFKLRPDRLFVTDARLDYTLVAVEPRAGEAELADRGWIPLIPTSGKAVVGERVNIIQHPGGEPQQVAVHQNQILDLVDAFLHYSTDTQRGSSGSPVLNDQWDVAALHHSGVPERKDGRILLTDGTPWDGSDRDRERISWIANEGVRISQLVAHLKNQVAGQTQQSRLLEECFEPCKHDFENLRVLAALQDERERSRPHSGTGPTVDESGTATWVLPLTVRVNLGGPAPGHGAVTDSGSPDAPVTTVRSTFPDGEPIDQDALRSALAHIQEHEEDVYYDEASDAEDRASYYSDELSVLSPAELFRHLGRLAERTHAPRLSYRSARLDHLYPWVDLRPDRKLKSIYSGAGFSPEEVVRLDLEVAALREALLRERIAAESFADPEVVQVHLDQLAAQLPFNCEHVVPQSWFGKAQPMKADLHHLFTCESPCNSFRSNTPYFDFPDEVDEAFRDACGRTEDSRTKFEPVEGKGPVARASLYFLIRYPGLIGDDMREMQAERLEILLRWHEEFPVDDYERHRNAAIFAVQGNRNPLIDFPHLAEAIDFQLGFGVLTD